MGDNNTVKTLGLRIKTLCPALIFSIALSVALVGGSKIIFGGSLRTIGFSSTQIRPFHTIDFLWVVLLTALLTVLAVRVPHFYLWLKQRSMKSCVPANQRQGALLHLALSGGLAITWLPMLLTYAPGGMNVDALFSIQQALYAGVSNGWDNHHPIGYALFLRPLLSIGLYFRDINLGVFIATIVQYTILASIFGYSVVWLAKKGVPTVFVALAAAFYALYPAFPIFAVGLSNDALFAGFLLLYTLHLVDVIQSDGKLLSSASGITTFAVLSLLIIFCRNNGILAVLLAGTALAIVYRLRVKSLYFALIGVLALTAIIQGPIYDGLGVNKPIVEALAIPLQQIAYVVVTDGDIPPKDRAFVDGLLPADHWPLVYAPCTVDPLKAKGALDKKYLAHNKKQFVMTWLSLLSRNPGSFVQAYMLETFGYWKPVIGRAGLSLPVMIKNRLGVDRTDLWERMTGHSLAQAYDTMTRSEAWRLSLNIGITVWLAFLSATVLILLGKSKYVVGLTPLLGSWLALMIAAPIAFTYRYLFMFVVCLPLVLLLPLIALNGDKRESGT